MQSQLPADQYAILQALHKDIQPSEFVLKDDICSIGRSAMCNIVITGQKRVSRLHAKIEREGPRYVLSDVNSANGTYVNERRISEPHLLQDEDMIGLGGLQAMLRFSDPDPTDVVASRLVYNNHSMKFYFDQHYLDLTPNEVKLLYYLYQNPGKLCLREDCFKAVWGREYDTQLFPDEDALNRLVSNIRQKLHLFDPAEIIKTHRKQGYELALEFVI